MNKQMHRIVLKDVTYYLQVKRWWGWKTLAVSYYKGDMEMLATNLEGDK